MTNTKAAHTPGPWSRNIRAGGKYPIVFAGRNKHVAQVCQQKTGDETEANIDLISAAPEMLEALEGFIEQGYCPSCGCDLWNTKGCPVCPKLRVAYDLLVRLGRRETRIYAEYAEPDPINDRNMAARGGQ